MRKKARKRAMNKPSHAKEILDAFEQLWGCEGRDFPEYEHEEPMDGLMLTVLSQNTNDKNRDKCFDQLKADFPTWDDVAAASVADITDRIRCAGLGEIKAGRMKEILAIVKEKFGVHSIKGLFEWSPEEAKKFLVSLPGVGVKTAAVVLMFDLAMPAFPVDTHVARISRRIGWVPEKMAADKIQEYLEATLPSERFHGGHLNFLEHGRHICDARKPKCGECPILEWCKYGKENSQKKVIKKQLTSSEKSV